MSRVLITGGTGFIGRHCLEPLRRAGFEVHGLTIDSPEDLPGQVCWHRASLFDGPAVARVMAAVRPTHLLHLAWHTVPGRYWTAPENVDWGAASLSLLRLFLDGGGTRFTGAGTCAEYAWDTADGVCREGVTPERPRTLYGTCKKAVHDVAMSLAEGGGLSPAWGRIFFLYGPGEHAERLVPSVVRALLAGREAACTTGTQVRDFLHVADVAGALVALLASPVSGAVNVASGQPVALRQVVQAIGRALGREGLVRLGARPVPEDEPPVLLADTRRLREEVGWSPSLPLEEGLAQTIGWWRDQPLPPTA